MNIYKKYLKRILDLFVVIVVLIMLSPLFTLLALILFVTNKGSVFFVQPRPGRNENIFNLYKLKSMNDKKNSDGKLLPAPKRITFIGNFLRKSSLDEIPQLFNVIKGDMSIVGPRPLRIEYLPLYTKKQSRRHEIKPGITGWAQVNGRNNLSWEEKF